MGAFVFMLSLMQWKKCVMAQLVFSPSHFSSTNLRPNPYFRNQLFEKFCSEQKFSYYALFENAYLQRTCNECIKHLCKDKHDKEITDAFRDSHGRGGNSERNAFNGFTKIPIS